MSISIYRSVLLKVICASVLTISTGSLFAANASTIRINVGAWKHKDQSGNTWSKDYGFKDGTQKSDRHTTADIKRTNNDRVYQSYRQHARELRYAIPVPNGKYKVTLHFAETDSKVTKAGKRVFDVYVEGSKVISKLDVFKQAGGANIAYAKSFSNVAVKGGALELNLKKINYGPFLSGIEIEPQNGAKTASNSNNNNNANANNSTKFQITKQPANEIATPGSTVNMQIGASGNSLKYQWYFNGNKVSGATKNTLRFASVANKNAGKYHCVVSSGNKSLKSQTAKLVVSGTDPMKNSKSATISWAAPTKRTNGKTLKAAEIAEYEIYHGVGSASNMEHSETVNGSTRQKLFKGLSMGNHFFSIRTVDKQGVRSNSSSTLKVVIK